MTWIKNIGLVFMCLACQLYSYGQSFVNAYEKNTGRFNYEKGVNTILLYEAKTVLKKLGNDAWEKYEFEGNEGYPRMECLNKGQTQLLRLFFMYGGNENEPVGFQVLKKPAGYKKPKKAFVSDFASFRSTLGISLGMTKSEVVKILGSGFEKKKDKEGNERIIFYTNNQEESVFKEYNGVGYSVIAVFKRNQLIDYSFGFEYP